MFWDWFGNACSMTNDVAQNVTIFCFVGGSFLGKLLFLWRSLWFEMKEGKTNATWSLWLDSNSFGLKRVKDERGKCHEIQMIMIMLFISVDSNWIFCLRWHSWLSGFEFYYWMGMILVEKTLLRLNDFCRKTILRLNDFCRKLFTEIEHILIGFVL